MKFIPILFSTPMVQAILEGRKTVTRRVVKWPQKCPTHHISIGESDNGPITEWCKYQPGGVLWCRETSAWNGAYWLYRADKNNDDYYHDFDTYEKTEKIKWKPSIFMPKEACRLFLEVVSVRPERLQEITDNDCHAEGISHPEVLKLNTDGTARGCFRDLWQSINGEESWSANPWVWRIEYKKIERPKDF